MSKEEFEAWMDEPVQDGNDPAPWIDGLAREAAFQAWQARDAEIAELQAELLKKDQENTERKAEIEQEKPSRELDLLEIKRLTDTVMRLRGERDQLKSCEADSKRLDFVLNEQAFIITEMGLGKVYQFWDQDEDENFHCLSGDEKDFFPTARDAIDAAMERSAQPTEGGK